ncbi:hypothetical protein chiPu_0026019 [Chiloscyllium punctatum]|uniref:Uncharacterized protein n=1 Tax=Chiloscyllium punctatum TaxID=137246 RepID=A0A401TI55_CHIPU|nr:hypothetical protein [Chiloscyllium punctatum]
MGYCCIARDCRTDGPSLTEGINQRRDWRGIKFLGAGGTTPTCADIGRQILSYGRRISLAEWNARIDVCID